MFVNLLAAIEADINQTIEQQQKAPHDINVATKKMQLTKLAMEYLQLENRYREVSGANNIY